MCFWATCLKDRELCARSQPCLRAKGTLHLGRVAKALGGGGIWEASLQMDGMLAGNSMQNVGQRAYEAEAITGTKAARTEAQGWPSLF